ncbi:MAG: MgtC/SapB family protein [Chthoniobacteraceae bacterium]
MDIFHTLGWQEIALRLGCATVAGAVLGLNRELKGKPAGLRTNALVCLGSALLVLAGIGIASGSDSMHQADVVSRVMQGIITGIGFLGAGVILRDTGGTQVHGITTAATIWLTATLGALCGVGLWPVALLGVGLTLVILVLGKPLEKFFHRKFPNLSEHSHEDPPPRK